MLLAHQHKAILDAINSGKPLPADMASALLAAYDEATKLQSANRAQTEQLQADLTSVRFKNAEALEVGDRFEAEVEKRVKFATLVLHRRLDAARDVVVGLKELAKKSRRLLSSRSHNESLSLALERADMLLPALEDSSALIARAHSGELALPSGDNLLKSMTEVRPQEMPRMRAEEPARWK